MEEIFNNMMKDYGQFIEKAEDFVEKEKAKQAKANLRDTEV